MTEKNTEVLKQKVFLSQIIYSVFTRKVKYVKKESTENSKTELLI